MPIYEYHCDECSHDFEYLVFSGQGPEECPKCSGKKIFKLMSTCGFFSKGSGGETVKASASTSGCSGCSASSCASCGH